jgi:hypothetical protein
MSISNRVFLLATIATRIDIATLETGVSSDDSGGSVIRVLMLSVEDSGFESHTGRIAFLFLSRNFLAGNLPVATIRIKFPVSARQLQRKFNKPSTDRNVNVG